MARVKEGARSQLSKKADGLVYVQFNGRVYTRKLPQRKKEAWTPGMLQNLERFKQVNTFCARFKDSVIPRIWNGMNPRMSGYALFLKTNMTAFGPDGSLQDVKRIKLSTGKLSFPEGLEAKRSVGDQNRVEVSWPREMHVGGVHMKDELMVISCLDGQYSEIIHTGITREQRQGTFELPSFSMLPAPTPMLLYLFFGSRDHRDYSESVCLELE